MKNRENQQQFGKVNLPELENPVNSSIKKESFNGAEPCFIGGFIGYYFEGS